MIKLTPLISPCIIGMASASPTVRSLREADDEPKHHVGGNKGGKPEPVGEKLPPSPEDDIKDTTANVEAEDEASENNNVGLESLTGLTFLLTKVISAAVDSNTIDALAASFVDHLRIKDFEAFKEGFAKFSKIEGSSQLLDAIASMVDHSKEKFNESENKPIWTQFKKPSKKS